jgi:hypothetical protein
MTKDKRNVPHSPAWRRVSNLSMLRLVNSLRTCRLAHDVPGWVVTQAEDQLRELDKAARARLLARERGTFPGCEI